MCPRGAPLPPEVAAVRRQRRNYALAETAFFVVLAAAVGVPLVLSGHAVGFLGYLAPVAAVTIGQAIAVDRADRRTHPRPRWHYFLFSLGFLVAAARGLFRGRIRRAMWRYPPPWLDNEQAKEA